VCTAQDQCHLTGTCNPASGTCSNPAKTNGSTCDDANACTRTDTCQSAACVGGNPVVCTASDQCHDAGVCTPATGTCSKPAKPDGSGCDDGNLCTLADQCVGGQCAGTSEICGDGVVEAQCNEQCDHGSANGVDQCCSQTCQPIDNDGDGICDGD